MNMHRTVLVSALSLGMVFAAHAASTTPVQNTAPVAHAPPPGAPAPMPVPPPGSPGAGSPTAGAPNIAGPGSPFANLNLSADQQSKIQAILMDARTQLMKVQQDTKTKVDNVLTTEQRAKLEASMQAQRQRMMQTQGQPMAPAMSRAPGK
jgi:Spy/CpxP family protein refolding chaperone